MSDSLRMLYANAAFLTSTHLRRITQASVFMADTVLLPSSITAQPDLDQHEQATLMARLSELHEIGAVRFWEIELARGEQPDVPFRSSRAGDDFILHEDYRSMFDQVNERLMQQRETFLKGEASSYDGITEIVLGRQALWRFCVAQELDANRLLLDDSTKGAMSHYLGDLLRYNELESKVIDEVEERLDLPDVSLLSIEDLERCRAELPAFRKKLIEKTTGRYDALYGDELVKEAATDILDELVEQTSKYRPLPVKIAGKSRVIPGNIATEGFWDVSQVVFAPLIAIKYGKLFFDWRSEGRTMTPLLLLLDIKSRLPGVRRHPARG